MAALLDNYGIGFIADDDETLLRLLGYAVENGKVIEGYYNLPYIYFPTGDNELWIYTGIDEEGKSFVDGFHTHSGSMDVVELAHSGIDVTPKEKSKLERVILFNDPKSGLGLIPINIINSDVLPSFLKGDIMKIQLIALPLEICYYADEDEYYNAQPSTKTGKKFSIEEGSFAPLAFLNNHSSDKYEKEKEYNTDKIVHFYATVTKLYRGTFDINGKQVDTFIHCRAKTMLGEIDFNHTIEQVPEELRDNLKVGAIISGICILSGDVAINEYENGIVKDFDHNLRLLRYSFVEGEAERLRSVLDENSVYKTDNSELDYYGPDDIIERMNYVRDNTDHKYFAYLATIAKSEDPLHPDGTRCIVLAIDEEDNYINTVFVEVDDSGMITEIEVCAYGEFGFILDTPEYVENTFDDIEMPDSIFMPIINRAKLNGIIDESIDEEQLYHSIPNRHFFVQNTERMLEDLKENPQGDIETVFKNIFGYLFAKSMEMRINDNPENSIDTGDGGYRVLVGYSPEDAFDGVIGSSLKEDKHKRLEEALEFGKQFYNDFAFFVKLKEAKDDEFIDLFKKAALAIQAIGWVGAEDFFSQDYHEH